MTNSPPTAPVVHLTPTAPTDLQDLVCSVVTASTDTDGDALTYQFAWTRNGQPFVGATSAGLTSTVPASATTATDVFGCAAAANDGKVNGATSASVSVTALQFNHQPSAPVVTVRPDSPTDLQDLVRTITTAAPALKRRDRAERFTLS